MARRRLIALLAAAVLGVGVTTGAALHRHLHRGAVQLAADIGPDGWNDGH